MSDDEFAGEEREGFEEATAHSEGNPWVVHGLNAVLSTVFALTIIWGLDFVGSVEFTPTNVVTAAIVLFAISYAASMR